MGPYFPAAFARDFHPAPLPPAGQAGLVPIALRGAIRDENGLIVPVALVESWQPGNEGRLLNGSRPFRSFNREYVRNGHFSLATVKPRPISPGTAGGAWRAPHVTLSLYCDGISHLMTQIFLAGEPLNGRDPVLCSLPSRLRSRLIAKRLPRSTPLTYALDIVLRGNKETPFFDDQVGER